VPARRNFLKSDPVETRYIIDEFTRIALANPEVAMSMHHNDNETYVLRSGDLALRIEELFRHKVHEHILPVEEETSIINAKGYIGKPESARKTRGEQFFFVNKRFIKDAYLNHALVSCYENLITREHFPFYVVHIDIDPARIDVNVHPTKTEIKFEDERAVYQIIRAIGKRALGQHYQVPLEDVTLRSSFTDLQRNSGSGFTDRGSASSNPSSPSRGDFAEQRFNAPSNKDWQQLYEVLQQPETIGDLKSAPSPKEQQELAFSPTPALNRNLMQVHNTLIISQVKTGIMLIDQSAAHERILYEKYLEALKDHPIPTQQKLLPKTIHTTASDEKLLGELSSGLSALGFEIHPLGKNTFVVHGVPASFEGEDEESFISDFLESYKEQAYASLEKNERIARLMAGKSRMKAGRALEQAEMARLVDELFACREPQYTPDGKPCVRTIHLDELRKMI
jgi:DNA mismatch repair protein MutL